MAAVGLLLAASAVDLTPTDAQTGAAGLGQAQAQLVTIDPRSAQLSFGVRFGPTVADHRNRVARATAQSTDYGLIAGSLTGEGCSGGEPFLRAEDLPQVMRADSRVPEDAEERTVHEGPITQSVRADERPFAEATSRLAELELPGIVRIAGAVDRTTSGLDEDGAAVATAEVEIAQLSLAAGLVQLRGLRWSAVHAAGQEPVGSFTISGASIAGVPVPTQEASDVIAAVNDVLGRLGLVLAPPVAHVEADVLFVDPLTVGIAPNPLRDRAATAVLATLQPLREQLFGALLDASCDAAAVITVVDILLGSVSGGGSLSLKLGGVQASTSLVEGFDGFGRSDAAPVRPTASTVVPPARSSAVADAVVPARPSTTGDGAAAPVVATTAAAVDAVSDGALAVGLATVLLGAALLEGDRRKMRRALVRSHTPGSAEEAP